MADASEPGEMALRHPDEPVLPVQHPTILLWLLNFLGDNRKRLLTCALVGLAISTAVAFLIPVRYEATARLMPPDQSSLSMNMMSMLTSKAGETLGNVAGDALGLKSAGATTIGVLTSRTIADDLINQFDLRKVYSKKRYEDARKKLSQHTAVSEDKKSGIITITVEDHDPTRVTSMVRAYIEDLNRRMAQLTTSSAHRERVFLEERLKELKAQLDQAAVKLSEFSSRNRTFDPQTQGKAMMEAASTLQGQLIAADTELRGLQQIYGPQNARVRAASARAAELRAKVRQLGGTREQVSDGETSLESGELYPSLEQLPILGNTYYDLARRVKVSEAVFEALTKQYELAKVQEAKEIPSIKVLDQPVMPESKVWPPRTFIIVAGTILTVLLFIVWDYSAARWSRLGPDDPMRVGVLRLLSSTGTR